MRDCRSTPSTLCLLGRLTATLLCIALLGGCRFGAPPSFFDQNDGIAQAIDTIRQRLSAPVRVLSVVIEPARITMRVQDSGNRNRVEEWSIERVEMAGVNWDRVSGPQPHELSLVNPDLEANLFELDEIDAASATNLVRAAIEHAALAGKADVGRIEIARQVFVVPRLASGEVRWTLDVRSTNESVQVFADAQGAIVGINIDGAERAKKLDILQELDLVADAVRAFRFVLGPDAILTAVSIGPRAVSFETNVADHSGPVPAAAGVSVRRAYTWNLNGLQRTSGRVSSDAATAKARSTFSVDDVDWTVLPKLAAEALAQLAMPQGRVTAIVLSKPANQAGVATVMWKIEVTDQGKNGAVLADASGEVKQVLH